MPRGILRDFINVVDENVFQNPQILGRTHVFFPEQATLGSREGFSVLFLLQGLKEFSAIAIAADLEEDFCGPCGACRQFLSEFNPDITIYLVRVNDKMVQTTSLTHLLPESFTPKRLKLAFHHKD
jgi:hypothetical protein